VRNFRYRNTNCYFLESSKDGRLLAVDAGWPCTIREYQRELKAAGLGFDRLAWAVVTHFHLDHAGLIGEFIALGIECFAFEGQLAAVDGMERTIHKNYAGYRQIDKARVREVGTAGSRAFFAGLGIGAEAIRVEGHSPDSVAIVTASGDAIVGDLPPLAQLMPEDEACRSSWERILGMGAKRACPAHAPAFDL
jgi:glyoxylase-like metal-dependent hydrolase (beta-lactamase superfamily II)